MDRADLAPDIRIDIVPVLPSLNFAQTRMFYLNHLGFEEMPLSCEEYMMVRRHRVELHFSLTDDPGLCFSSSVFFRFPDVQPIFDEFQRKGVDVVRSAERGPSGQAFHLRDPHGNLLIFADDLGHDQDAIKVLMNGHRQD